MSSIDPVNVPTRLPASGVTAPMLEAGQLALVVRAGAGYNTIDVATASKRGIYVSNCPGKNAVAVAELAFALLLALDRRIPDNVAELRAGKWNKKEYSKARGLYGRTLGLLGDRYIELTPGSPDKPPVEPGGLIAAIDPVDYEQVLGRSGDIVTNVVEVTTSLKDVLQTIQRGEGLLGAMVRNTEFGDATLQNLESSLQNVRATSQRLDGILARVERGEGVAGRLLRDTPDSRKLWARLDHSVAEIDELSTRLANGNGALVRLIEDEAYGRRVLENLDVTLRELRDVMDKVNAGQGTLGKLVNDASLYDDARGLVSDVRSSWLVAFYRGVSGLWPFGRSAPPEAPTTP